MQTYIRQSNCNYGSFMFYVIRFMSYKMRNVLNRLFDIVNTAVSQFDINRSLAEPITQVEVRKAIDLLCNGKYSGTNAILT